MVPAFTLKRLIRKHTIISGTDDHDVWWVKEGTRHDTRGREVPIQICYIRQGRFLVAGSESSSVTVREMLLNLEHARRHKQRP